MAIIVKRDSSGKRTVTVTKKGKEIEKYSISKSEAKKKNLTSTKIARNKYYELQQKKKKAKAKAAAIKEEVTKKVVKDLNKSAKKQKLNVKLAYDTKNKVITQTRTINEVKGDINENYKKDNTINNSNDNNNNNNDNSSYNDRSIRGGLSDGFNVEGNNTTSNYFNNPRYLVFEEKRNQFVEEKGKQFVEFLKDVKNDFNVEGNNTTSNSFNNPKYLVEEERKPIVEFLKDVKYGFKQGYTLEDVGDAYKTDKTNTGQKIGYVPGLITSVATFGDTPVKVGGQLGVIINKYPKIKKAVDVTANFFRYEPEGKAITSILTGTFIGSAIADIIKSDNKARASLNVVRDVNMVSGLSSGFSNTADINYNRPSVKEVDTVSKAVNNRWDVGFFGKKGFVSRNGRRVSPISKAERGKIMVNRRSNPKTKNVIDTSYTESGDKVITGFRKIEVAKKSSKTSRTKQEKNLAKNIKKYGESIISGDKGSGKILSGSESRRMAKSYLSNSQSTKNINKNTITTRTNPSNNKPSNNIIKSDKLNLITVNKQSVSLNNEFSGVKSPQSLKTVSKTVINDPARSVYAAQNIKYDPLKIDVSQQPLTSSNKVMGGFRKGVRTKLTEKIEAKRLFNERQKYFSNLKDANINTDSQIITNSKIKPELVKGRDVKGFAYIDTDLLSVNSVSSVSSDSVDVSSVSGVTNDFKSGDVLKPNIKSDVRIDSVVVEDNYYSSSNDNYSFVKNYRDNNNKVNVGFVPSPLPPRKEVLPLQMVDKRTSKNTPDDSFLGGRGFNLPRIKRNKISDDLVTPGYDVFVRKGGKDLLLSSGLSESKAFKLGLTTVRGSARATFYTKKSGFNIKGSDNGFNNFFVPNDFYTKKGDKGNTLFIEKRSKRINTPGELRDITFKGVAAIKRKKSVKGDGLVPFSI